MEGDDYFVHFITAWKISIHSLRVEGDEGRVVGSVWIYISIHSLRVEGDIRYLEALFEADISIHSLRVEGDHFSQYFCKLLTNFNPLPPRGGRRF